jgi:hypothetical protein
MLEHIQLEDAPDAHMWEWLALRKELRALQCQAIAAFNRRFGSKQSELISSEPYRQMSEACRVFCREILKIVPRERADRYLAFHMLIGSTTNYKSAPKLDFPCGYSVKNFYQDIGGVFETIDGARNSTIYIMGETFINLRNDSEEIRSRRTLRHLQM